MGMGNRNPLQAFPDTGVGGMGPEAGDKGTVILWNSDEG
jgi:hypothetical protein